MPVEKEVVGTGITARTQVRYSGHEMEPALRDAFSKRREAREAAGGDFGAASLAMTDHCRLLLQAATGSTFARDSPEWFAERILQLHKIAKLQIADGNSDVAALFAFNAGTLWATAVAKWNWEPDVLRGREFSPKGRGLGDLAKLVEAKLLALGLKASAEQVFAALRQDRSGTIDHIDDDRSIEWTDSKGRAHTTGFARFKNIVSERKKKILTS